MHAFKHGEAARNLSDVPVLYVRAARFMRLHLACMYVHTCKILTVCAGYIKIIRPPLLLAADFIYDLHEELMEEYVLGGIVNCSGIIMDNTRANM